MMCYNFQNSRKCFLGETSTLEVTSVGILNPFASDASLV